MDEGKYFYKIKYFLKQLFSSQSTRTFTPVYRVAEVEKTEQDEFVVVVQMITKSITFRMKPEEILASDKLVNQFSPSDIRTLTYLGYLGINSPKYKILAKQLSENDEKLIFALKKRGNKKVIVKTAEQILNEKEILESLDAKDANLVGYTVASESALSEKRQKAELAATLASNKAKTLNSNIKKEENE